MANVTPIIRKPVRIDHPVPAKQDHTTRTIQGGITMIRKIAGLLACTTLILVGLSATLLYGAPQMGNDKASTEQIVTGCLQKGLEPVGFFIIGADNKHWELYSGKEVSLADHVGHTVSVKGSVATRSAQQEEKSQPNEKKETGAREHSDLQVSSLKMVSETCSK
jgi:hypothetical protein